METGTSRNVCTSSPSALTLQECKGGVDSYPKESAAICPRLWHDSRVSLTLENHIHTVIHLSAYLSELQEDALALRDRLPTSEEGAFRPEQEVEVQTLLIGYWQSRVALIELVESIRKDEPLYAPGGERYFLVAYAAALLLIDAAAFLRESAKHRAVLRRKLNEENREFGIPPRVYDTVQRSLGSTRTAWHMYHAIQYYREHESVLNELAAHDSKLSQVMAVIDQRKHRLDQSLARLQATRARMRVRRIGSGTKRWLYQSLYGIQKVGGIVLADRYLKRGHEPSIPENVRERILPHLKPGDILAVRKEYAVTNYFLPGYWPHVALYLGESSHHRVLESMKDGVYIRGIGSPFSSDSVVVLRPKLPPEAIQEGIKRGLSHEGKGYDFSFDFSRSDRLVCTEVVYRSFDGVGDLHFPLVRRAGRMTLSGNDLVEMALEGKNLEPVLVYAPMHDTELITDREAVQRLVQRCMEDEQAIESSA